MSNNAMHSSIFLDANDFTEHNNSPQHNLRLFLENFPEREFWRFFVERTHYDSRKAIYWWLFSSLRGISIENAMQIPIDSIENEFRQLTIGDIYNFAEKMQNCRIVDTLTGFFHLADRKGEIVANFVNKHQGWLGFDNREPNYLFAVTQGFKFVLSNCMNKDLVFDFEFIKNLHKVCTSGVKNMLTQIPGQLRKYSARWEMKKNYNSLDGLIETINYLKLTQNKFEMSGLSIEICYPNDCLDNICNFDVDDTKSLAEKIWNALLGGAKILYVTNNNIDFLKNICERHIIELDIALRESKTNQEKLTAIFTFLKYTVLHHPFQDGVGRTYSMLILQYLLIHENFLPILIKDSNIIPGYSIKELMDEYSRAENEMKIILEDVSQLFISSTNFAESNVNTIELLSMCSDEDKSIFEDCLKIYLDGKRECLSRLKNIPEHVNNNGSGLR